MDWITKLRNDRKIGSFSSKYGPWTVENFKGRNPVSEAIDEGIDLLNYLEMAELSGQISSRLTTMLTLEVERILNILKLNEK